MTGNYSDVPSSLNPWSIKVKSEDNTNVGLKGIFVQVILQPYGVAEKCRGKYKDANWLEQEKAGMKDPDGRSFTVM